MEIRYKRTYAPPRGKRYTAGEIGALLGYALEIADPRVPLQEGRLSPGEICLMLFAISPEEYALKDAQPRDLDALAERLTKEIPADRLLGWRIVDLKGMPVQKDIRIKTGGSIDGGAFAQRAAEAARRSQAGPVDEQLLEARRLQKLCADQNAPEGVRQDWERARRALGEAILGLEKIYVARDALQGGRWNAIGFDGRMEIFTTQERAQRAKAQVAAAHAGVDIWALKEIPGNEIEAFLRGCVEEGLKLARVDNGFAAAELELGDICACVPGENAALRCMLQQEVQYGTRWQKMKEAGAPEEKLRGALESTLTLRGFAWRQLGNAKLYVLCAGGRRENCVVVGEKDASRRLLAVFTLPVRAAAFAEKLQGDVAAVEMDFDELVRRAAVCAGLIIDPGMLGYRLPAEEFERVKQIRSQKPAVVRIQPPEAKREESAPAPAAKNEDMGGLPDPDEFDVPARAAQEAAEAEGEAGEGQREEARAPKKGFFRKLFGK